MATSEAPTGALGGRATYYRQKKTLHGGKA